MNTRKRGISDSDTLSGTRRKLDQVEPAPQSVKHTTLVTIERKDLNDKVLDEDAQIKKICDAVRRLIVVFDDLGPSMPSLEFLLVSLAKQVGHDIEQAVLVSSNLFAESFGERDALVQELLVGINEGFASVRRLEILQPEGWEKEIRVPPTETLDISESDVIDAWKRPYEGTRHKLLLDNICAMYQKEGEKNQYRNQVSIIQSSGYGKSRMVHELSKLIFTIPMNLRKESDSTQLAYPKPDSDVRDFLTKSRGPYESRAAYMLLFMNLFKLISQWLKGKQLSRSELATAWADHLSKNRDELYNNALKSARAELSSKQDTYKNEDDEAVQSVYLQGIETTKTLGLLMEDFRHVCGRDNAKSIEVVLYVDEVHSLHTPTKIKNDKALYTIFCSCMADLSKLPFFVIFLSTTSSLVYFAPVAEFVPSARVGQEQPKLQAPITETPFDSFFNKQLSKDEYLSLGPVRPGSLTHSDISKIEFMTRFGRPLFWTLLKAGAKHSTVLDVVGLAQNKLAHSQHTSGTVSQIAKLAVLDVVLSLGYEHRHKDLYNNLSDMVASHMCTAYSIPDHRQYFRSGYPSEPVLAEAASQLLWKMRQVGGVLETLKDNLDNYILDRGQLGELVGRELLTHAYQKAVKADKDGKKHFSNGCYVNDFIKELFSEGCAVKVLNSLPDNSRHTVSLETTFKDARMRFTHFAKVGDASGVTTNAMWAAYVRGMAIICPTNQNRIDALIPILLWDTRICQHVMTALMIQFKRRLKPGTKAAYSVDAEEIQFFDQDCTCEHGNENTFANFRPYIVFVMELGIQPVQPQLPKKGSKNNSMSSPSKVDPGIGRGTRQSPRFPPAPTCHYRYQIFAYGCSSTVYKVIEPAEKIIYALLLQTSGFFPEHARQDAASLSAVMQLKPIFKFGPDSYHWIIDPALHTDVEVDQVDEMVVVGDDDVEDHD